MSNVVEFDGRRGELAAGPTVQREPPVNIMAEQGVLGAILWNNEAYGQVASIVKAEHFSEEIHRRIFDVMGQLAQAGRPILPAALRAYLGNHEVGSGVDTQTYIARLAAEAVTVIGAPDYAAIVRDMATRRKLIVEAEKLIEAAHNARVDVTPDDVAAESLDGLRTVLDAAPRLRTRFDLGTGTADLVNRMERIMKGEEQSPGLSTGYPDLDTSLSGLQAGTLVVAAGRVGMGKTVLMTNLAYNVARHNEGVGVLEFSLEIPGDQLQARHVAQAIFDHRMPVTFGSILNGKVTDDVAERVVLAQREFLGLPVVVECPTTITAAEIAARIQVEKKRMALKGVRLGVVLIDYLDKITALDRYAGQRTYEIQEIVSTLKSAALANDVCVVLLAQLNRATESREDKRPSLADLKSSGALEQEAHAVIFVYREAYYLQKSAEFRDNQDDARARFHQVQHDVELIIGKNRGGPEGTVHLWGDVSCSVFASQARGM